MELCERETWASVARSDFNPGFHIAGLQPYRKGATCDAGLIIHGALEALSPVPPDGTPGFVAGKMPAATGTGLRVFWNGADSMMPANNSDGRPLDF